MKECLSCHAKIEDLLHTCPNCGGSSFVMYGGQEVADAILKQIKAREHNDRGGQFMMQGNYIEAEKEFRQAVESNPLNAAAHSNVGLSLYKQGQIEEAIPWLEKALSINPRHEGAREALAKWKTESKAISKISCEKCGYRLPKSRVPQSSRQAMWGGWICPNCGAELDRKGRVIGKGTSQLVEKESQPANASINEKKKAGCWIWPVLVLGILLSIAGFCLGSIIIYGEISGVSADPGNIVSLLGALGCFSLSPLFIGLVLVSISIYFLRRKQSKNGEG